MGPALILNSPFRPCFFMDPSYVYPLLDKHWCGPIKASWAFTFTRKNKRNRDYMMGSGLNGHKFMGTAGLN